MTYISIMAVVVVLTTNGLPVLVLKTLMSVIAVTVAMAILTLMVMMARMAIIAILPLFVPLDCLKGLDPSPRRSFQLSYGRTE